MFYSTRIQSKKHYNEKYGPVAEFASSAIFVVLQFFVFQYLENISKDFCLFFVLDLMLLTFMVHYNMT